MNLFYFGGPVALVLVACLLFVFLVRSLRLLRARYTFRGGWLYRRSGLLFVHDESFELIHLVDAEVTRGPISQMTGYGTLILHFDKRGTVKIRGVAKINELYALRDDLMNGARILRSHPIVKGLIGT